MRVGWVNLDKMAFGLVAIATTFCLIISSPNPGKLQATELPDYFPNLQIHPLPPSLAQWERVEEVGDYFTEIETTPLGYLIWLNFP